MTKDMNNSGKKTSAESAITEANALRKEISRAMEMMKRVKKSNVAQVAASEHQMTYFIPNDLVLCQSC